MLAWHNYYFTLFPLPGFAPKMPLALKNEILHQKSRNFLIGNSYVWSGIFYKFHSFFSIRTLLILWLTIMVGLLLVGSITSGTGGKASRVYGNVEYTTEGRGMVSLKSVVISDNSEKEKREVTRLQLIEQVLRQILYTGYSLGDYLTPLLCFAIAGVHVILLGPLPPPA
jgi:hypothetical protein